MSTNKKKMFIYLSQELVKDVSVAYRIHQLIERRRGLSPSMSKWMEGILKKYVNEHRSAIDEYKKLNPRYKE